MNNPLFQSARRLPMLAVLSSFLALISSSARADFNLSVSLDQFGSASQNDVSYGIFLGLNTTNTPITYYEVYTPHSNSYTGVGPGSSFNVLSLDANGLFDELTNGDWKLILNVGDPSEQTYLFHVTLNGLSPSSFPSVEIFNPPYFSSDIPANATFSFTGPADFPNLSVSVDQGNNFYAGAGLAPGTTNWTPDKALQLDTQYNFFIAYSTDGSSLLNFSTPLTGHSQPLPGWSTSTQINLQDESDFTTETNSSELSLQTVLDATNLTWSTSGDASWFGETNVSFDGISAAQSGVLQDEQESTLQTTVTGPGTISFYWQTDGESDEFDLEFDDNGGYVDDIGSQTSWSQFTYSIGTGVHVLTWNATSGDGSSTNDAAYLDEVVFTPQTGPFPPLGSWASTGSMPAGVQGRGEFTLTTLGTGKALATGGLISGFPEVSSSEADLFNPATGTWTNDSFMNFDRRQQTATVLDGGKVLVAGGFSGPLGSSTTTNSSAEIYDPASHNWNTTGSMLTARAGHAATLLNNGLVLVAGGLSTSTSELYSPTSQTWTNTGSLNEPRFGATLLTLPNGKALIIGGAADNTAEIFDPATGQWNYSNPMLTEQDGATATLLTNGTVLVAGGVNSGGNQTGFSEIYDPSTGNWTQVGTMTTPRSEASAVLLANGVVLVAGGTGVNGTLTNSELYFPATAQWTATGPMLEARSEFQSVLLPDGRALATGGFSSTAEIYTTIGGGSTTPVSIVLANPIQLSNGSFQFSWTNLPGSTNIVFATTNIVTPFSSWLNLGSATETPAGSGQFQFTDTAAGSSTLRFYRVRSP